MATAPVSKYIVIDDYLPVEMAHRLLTHALDPSLEWRDSGISRTGDGAVDRLMRESSYALVDLGSHRPEFESAIMAREEQLCRATGSTPFGPEGARLELQLIRHGNKGHYSRHIDTITDAWQRSAQGDRIVSTVLYLHRDPKMFSGGELALFPFVGDEPAVLIEPIHNRLFAFPSIAPHAVRPVACASDSPLDARFSINCWLCRPRRDDQ